MKKLILFPFLLLSLTISAQANLQFNQVKNIMTSTSYSVGCCQGFGWTSSTSFSVPTGKVWKVEALYQNIFGNGGSQSGHASYIISVDADANNLMKRHDDNTILWLSEGTYAIRFYVACSGCWGTVNNTVNALEFNMVP